MGLKNPDKYASVSAFAPICNPMEEPWGQKALPLYFGDDKETWKQYDATELIKTYKGKDLHILCDQGTADNFLTGDVNQLQPLAPWRLRKKPKSTSHFVCRLGTTIRITSSPHSSASPEASCQIPPW